MKHLIYLLFLGILLSSCTNTKKVTSASTIGEANYFIKEINKKNSWYVIYAERKDTLYKIVTKVEADTNKNCKKIVVGKWYDLLLISHKSTAPIINGVKLDPVGYTGCYQFDSETTICLEPKRGVYDLFYTNDLKGICYLK